VYIWNKENTDIEW